MCALGDLRPIASVDRNDFLQAVLVCELAFYIEMQINSTGGRVPVLAHFFTPDPREKKNDKAKLVKEIDKS